VTDFGKVAGWCIREPKKEIAKLKSGTVVGTTRGKVVAELYAAALKTPGVDIVLGAKLVSADVAAATMTFSRARAGGGGSGAKEEEEEEEEEELTVKYGQARVLDCTGCFSKLRTVVATRPFQTSHSHLVRDFSVASSSARAGVIAGVHAGGRRARRGATAGIEQVRWLPRARVAMIYSTHPVGTSAYCPSVT
jgi:ribosomal protein L12E/L44/L45/RPP1/RPP2